MRIAVTGATGNLGAALIPILEADDAVTSVVALARRRPDRASATTTYRSVDISTDALVEHLRGADVLVHLAWAFQPTHDPVETWRINVVGGMRVFEAAAEAGVGAIVYSSSVGAYSPGPRLGEGADDPRVDESWPTHSRPTAAYGREKAYLERYLDSFGCRHPEIRVVRVRPAFIFRHDAATSQRRIFLGPLPIGRLLRPEVLPVFPDIGGLRFQAVHGQDAAEAFHLAVISDARGAFNVAAEPALDGAALARLFGARPLAVPARPVRALLAAAWHLRVVPAAPELFDLVLDLPLLDTTRARTELGWQPRHRSTDAVRDVLAGMQSGAAGDTPPLEPGFEGAPARERLAMSIGEGSMG